MKLELNKAAEYFNVKNINNCSFLDNSKDYDQTVLTYLTHIQITAGCLKYVFGCDNFTEFSDQITHINILASYFKCPALFICSISEIADSPLVLCGVAFNNQLLLINPLGPNYIKNMFAQTLSCLVKTTFSKKPGVFDKLFVMCDVIQKDTVGQHSGGPVCVEILKSLNMQLDSVIAQFMEWSDLSIESMKLVDDLYYHEVQSGQFLIPDRLRNAAVDTFSEIIQRIRREHFEELTSLANFSEFKNKSDVLQATLDAQNRFLEQDVLNAPEQKVMLKLVAQRFSLLDIFEDDSIKVLQQRLLRIQTGNLDFDRVSSGQLIRSYHPSSIKQQPKLNKNVWEIDVPGDDSCLFWSVALAFLLPVLEEDEKFLDRYTKLFGKIDHLQYIKKILKKYNPFSNLLIFQDEIMNRLIREEFRARVIGFIADDIHKEDFRNYYDGVGTFEDYLTNMQNTSSWAGEFEIRAMSMLLECNISSQQGDLKQCYPDLINQEKPTVEVVYVNYLGKIGNDAHNNHYHFNISQKLSERYQISTINSLHAFDLVDNIDQDLKPDDVCVLKDIFEQVLVSDILFELKVHQNNIKGSRVIKNIITLLSESVDEKAIQENQLDFKLLRIHLQMFAQYASLRYEPFIANCISSFPLLGVIPLARVGARRVVEFLSREMESWSCPKESVRLKQFHLVLLDGLVHGKSVKKRFESQLLPVRGLISKGEQGLEYSADEILSLGEVFERSIIGYHSQNKKTSDVIHNSASDKITKLIKFFPTSSYQSVIYFSTYEELCRYSDYYAESLKKLNVAVKGRHRSSSDGDESSDFSAKGLGEDHPLTFYEWIKECKRFNNKKVVWVVNETDLKLAERNEASDLSVGQFINNIYQGHGPVKRKKYIYGNYSNIRMNGLDFRGCAFKNAILSNTDLQLVDARNVLFKNVNFIETRLDCANLDSAKFVNCNVSNSTWYKTSIDLIDFSGCVYIEREIRSSHTDKDDVLTHLLIPNLADFVGLFGLVLNSTYGISEENQFIPAQSFIYMKYVDLEYFRLYTSKIQKNLIAIKAEYAHRLSPAASNRLKFLLSKIARILGAVSQIQQQVLHEFHVMPALFDFQNLTKKDLRYQDIDTIGLINELSLLRKELFKREKPKSLRQRFFNSSYNQLSENEGDNTQFFTRSGTLLYRSLPTTSKTILSRSSSGVENDQVHRGRSSGLITRHSSLAENLLDESEDNNSEQNFESEIGAQKELYLSQMRCSQDRMLHEVLEKALCNIKGSMEKGRENYHPSCYISYIHSSDISEHDEMTFFLKTLRDHLRLAGIKALLNLVDNRTAYKREDYTGQILSIEFVLLICTKSTVKMLQNKETILRSDELRLIEERTKNAKKDVLMVAIMEKDKLFAADGIGFEYLNKITYWHQDSYLKYLGNLIAYLWGISKSHKVMKKHWLPLRNIGAFPTSDVLLRSNKSHDNDLSLLNTSSDLDVDSELYSSFVNAIKEKYRYNVQQQSSAHEFNEAFFDLTLVKSKDGSLESYPNFKSKNANASQEKSTPDSKSMANNYVISLDSIFLDLVGERGYLKRILMQGKPGVGKSTLCTYIAYNWACNAGADRLGLWSDQFDIVLLINLHKLLDYPDEKCLIEYVIFEELLSSNANWKLSDIKNILKTKSKKILLLLDGFDEVEATYQSNNLKPSPQGRLLHSLIDAEWCSTVITSRLDSVKLINGVFDEVIEIVGFSKDEIYRFVQRVMRKANILLDYEEELIRMIDLNPHIAAISHIPVNLELICEFWIQKDSKGPITMTQFFDAINDWLQERAFRNVGFDHELPKSTSFNKIIAGKLDLAEFLKVLAWKCAPLASTMITEELIVGSLAEYDINIEYFRKITPQLLSIGLLNCLRKDNFQRRVFYFPHRTFLEYYASLFWISSYLSDERREIALGMLKQNINNSRFEVVWQFVSGHLENMKQTELQKLFFEQLLSYRSSKELTSANHFRSALLLLCYEEAKTSINDNFIDSEIKGRATQSLHYLLDHIDDSSSDEVRKLVFTWKSCGRLFNSEFIVSEIKKILQDNSNFKRKLAMFTLLTLVGDFNHEILSFLILISEKESRVSSDICCIIGKYFIKKQKYVSHKEIGLTLFQYMLKMLNSESDVLRSNALEWLAELTWQILPERYHEIAFSALYEEYLRKGDKALINAIAEIDLKKISEKVKCLLFNMMCDNIFKQSELPKRSSIGGRADSFDILKIFIPKLFVSDRLTFISIALNILKFDKKKSPSDVLKIIYHLFQTASFEINNESIINDVIKELSNIKENKLLIRVYSIWNILLGFEFDSDLHENILLRISETIKASTQKDKKILVKILGKLYLKSKSYEIKNKVVDIIIYLLEDGGGKNINFILLALIGMSDQLSSDHVIRFVPKLTLYFSDINIATVRIAYKLFGNILRECKDEKLIDSLIHILINRAHHADSSVRLTVVSSLNVGNLHSIDKKLSNELALMFIKMLNDSSIDVIVSALNGLQNLNILFFDQETRDLYVTSMLKVWNHSDLQIKEKVSCILSKIEWAKMPAEITAIFKNAKSDFPQGDSPLLVLEDEEPELVRIEEMLSSEARADKNSELKSLILNMVNYETLHMKKILMLLAIYLNKYIDPLPSDITRLISRFNSGVLIELINNSETPQDYAKLLYWLCRSKNLVLFYEKESWKFLNESEEAVVLPLAMNEALNMLAKVVIEDPVHEVVSDEKKGCVLL